MKILVVGLNYAPEPIGIAVYTTGMVEGLVQRGHDVQVIAGKPYYPQWLAYDGFRDRGYQHSREGGANITRCPHYIPADPSGARRLVHHASFAMSARGPALRAAGTFGPDLVFTVAPSMIAVPTARAAARRVQARSWLHIQDFEVDAMFATGLASSSGAIGKFAHRFQDYAMAGFDRYSSISPQMCARLRALGAPAHKVVEFRNWADLSRVRVLARPSALRDQLGITTPHVALYSGNLGNKQGLEIIPAAARLLAGRDDLTFLVCGEGPRRAQLESEAAGLANVRFAGLQPAERLEDLLGLASVHLLPQLADAADLVLPSKLTNMLASGRPVIATAAPGTGLAAEVEGCGVVTAPEDHFALATAVAALLDDPVRCDALGRAARERAEQRWSKEAILDRLDADLRRVVNAS